ncbi:MAG: NAD-dependent epimerase/dehydratase family protein [Bacteroidales bacterium]
MPLVERVLLTGANGLLGANIAEELLKRGYIVRAIIRHGSNCIALDDLDVELFYGDISSEKDLDQAIQDCSYVIHAAATTSQLPGDYWYSRRINLEVTKRLVHISQKYTIKRFVYISTTNAFTNGSIINPGDEKGGFMPWLKDSGYAYSKYLAQEFVIKKATDENFPALVLAPTFMLGSRDGKLSSGKLLMHSLKKRIVFYPPGGKNIIDVGHVAEVVVNTLQIGEHGEKYLLAGENITYASLFRLIKKVSKRKQILLPLPKTLLVVISTVFSFLYSVFGWNLVFVRVNQRLLCLDNYFTGKKAEESLGLKKTVIEKAIHKEIDWFRGKGFL